MKLLITNTSGSTWTGTIGQLAAAAGSDWGWLSHKRALSIADGDSVTIADVSPEEVSQDAVLRAAKDAGDLQLDFIVDDGDVTEIPPARVTLAADAAKAANAMTGETIHASLTIPVEQLDAVRKQIRFRSRIHVTGANGSDTWLFRTRLGGLTGEVLIASAAIDIAADDVYEMEGTIELKTLGESGTFDAVSYFRDPVNGASDAALAVLAGAIDTTDDVLLTITGACSSTNAGNAATVRRFEFEVLPG